MKHADTLCNCPKSYSTSIITTLKPNRFSGIPSRPWDKLDFEKIVWNRPSGVISPDMSFPFQRLYLQFTHTWAWHLETYRYPVLDIIRLVSQKAIYTCAQH